jgi:hypothetical protein
MKIDFTLRDKDEEDNVIVSLHLSEIIFELETRGLFVFKPNSVLEEIGFEKILERQNANDLKFFEKISKM